MSRFKGIKGFVSLALVALALAAFAGSAGAGVVFDKNYSVIEQTRRGPSEGNLKHGLAIVSEKLAGYAMFGSDMVDERPWILRYLKDYSRRTHLTDLPGWPAYASTHRGTPEPE